MVDIARLSKVCSIRKYTVDEMVFNQGDPGHSMFILLSGSADILIEAADGELVPVSTLKAGDFFGEMSILEGEPRSASVRIIENAIALVIDEQIFPNVINNDPSLAMNIMKGLSGRLRRQNGQISKLQAEKRALEIELSAKENDDGELEENEDGEPETELNSIDHRNKSCPESTQSSLGEGHEKAVQTYNQSLGPQSADEEAASKASDSAFKRAEFDSILPKGHKVYAIPPSLLDETFLFSKFNVCPVCGKTFEEKMVRSSKLRVTKVEKDFRRRYEKFEPLWYGVWVCPHCYYANFSFAFEQVTDKEKKAILKNIPTIQQQIKLEAEWPRSLDEVFRRYYLALNYMRTVMPDVDKIGKLWTRLVWLYDDVDDVSMAKIAAGEAFLTLKDQFYTSGKRTSPDQDQYFALMLGELSLRLGKQEEASTYFRQAIVNRGGNKMMNEQARDRILELSVNKD